MADIFAAVWDSYNGACILNRRDASERDLRVLKTMLETSLANSPELSCELGQAWLDYHTDTRVRPDGSGRRLRPRADHRARAVRATRHEPVFVRWSRPLTRTGRHAEGRAGLRRRTAPADRDTAAQAVDALARARAFGDQGRPDVLHL